MHRPHPERTLAFLAFMAALLAGCGGASDTQQSATGSTNALAPTESVTPSPSPTPEYRAPDLLVAGDCFDPIYDSDSGDLLAAVIVSCDVPHLLEAFGTLSLGGPADEPYPGRKAADSQAIQACDAEFAAYVGVVFDDTRLSYSYWYPNEQTWAAGDRFILCAVEGTEASPLIHSVRDSEL
jgi:hypothetical protein